MILREQRHTNLSRSYCRGLKNRNLADRQYDEIYLTTKFSYALAYAGVDGIIEEYLLKDTADIFSMRCRTDEDRLRKYCQEKPHLKFYLRTFERLRDNDWAGAFDYPYERQWFLEAIKALGYDGYFNFEIDKDYFHKYRDLPGFSFIESDISSPAVALFSESAVVKKAEYSGAAIRATPVFRKAKQAELKYISDRVPELIKNGERDTAGYLKKNTRCLSIPEIQAAAEEAATRENLELQEELAELRRIRYECRFAGRKWKDETDFIRSSRYLKDNVSDY